MGWIRRRLWGRQHGRRHRHPRPYPGTALNLGGTSRFASGTARHHAASPPADWQRQSADPTRAPRTRGEGFSTPSGGLLGQVTTRSSRKTCPVQPARPAPATPAPLLRPPYPGRPPVSCMKVPTRTRGCVGVLGTIVFPVAPVSRRVPGKSNQAIGRFEREVRRRRAGSRASSSMGAQTVAAVLPVVQPPLDLPCAGTSAVAWP